MWIVPNCIWELHSNRKKAPTQNLKKLTEETSHFGAEAWWMLETGFPVSMKLQRGSMIEHRNRHPVSFIKSQAGAENIQVWCGLWSSSRGLMIEHRIWQPVSSVEGQAEHRKWHTVSLVEGQAGSSNTKLKEIDGRTSRLVLVWCGLCRTASENCTQIGRKLQPKT